MCAVTSFYHFNFQVIFLCRFELGSGPAVLLSLEPVNNGQWHSVEVFR